MTKLYMCQFGNCHSTDTPITVSNKIAEQRARFCSSLHAAQYLLGIESCRRGYSERQIDRAMNALSVLSAREADDLKERMQ
jgi:non-canonical (house-cleaning) NTP pyrophosphatase